MHIIHLESYSIDDIPILTLAQANLTQAPLVVYMHGMTGRKEDGLSLGYELAQAGVFFVSFDAMLHGERTDERLTTTGTSGNAVYPPDSGLDRYLLMHHIIVQNGRDLESIAAHFATDSRVNVDRLGITGMSMGGFSTFYIAARNPRVRAAVPLLGIPAFVERWQDVVLESTTYPQWVQTMADAADQTVTDTAFMRDIDPFDDLIAFAPKPLMMILGDLDTHSPKIYTVRLYCALQAAYADAPERLRLAIHDDIGHTVTPQMINDTRDWFVRYLMP